MAQLAGGVADRGLRPKDSERRLHHVSDCLLRVSLVADPLQPHLDGRGRYDLLAALAAKPFQRVLGKTRIQEGERFGNEIVRPLFEQSSRLARPPIDQRRQDRFDLRVGRLSRRGRRGRIHGLDSPKRSNLGKERLGEGDIDNGTWAFSLRAQRTFCPLFPENQRAESHAGRTG
jgi:hypothetical protein